MSIEVEYALRPCAGIGFAGYWRNDPLRGIIRGDLVWCLAKPTYIDLYLSGIAGSGLGFKTPTWIPVGGSLDALCGAQLTEHLSINLKDLEICSSLHPWLRFSGMAAASLARLLVVTEVAAIAYALYDPFYTNKLVLITGIGAGVGISPPKNLSNLFSALGMEVKWTGEVLLFFESLFQLGRDDDGKSGGRLRGIVRGRKWSKLSGLYRNLQ
jgi:hypothetical protein